MTILVRLERGDMRRWQMQDAKARLSELVKLAETEGPQDITVHGKSVAVVVARETFDRLSGSGESLLEFMRRSPLYGRDDIEFVRDRSPPRKISL